MNKKHLYLLSLLAIGSSLYAAQIPELSPSAPSDSLTLQIVMERAKIFFGCGWTAHATEFIVDLPVKLVRYVAFYCLSKPNYKAFAKFAKRPAGYMRTHGTYVYNWKADLVFWAIVLIGGFIAVRIITFYKKKKLQGDIAAAYEQRYSGVSGSYTYVYDTVTGGGVDAVVTTVKEDNESKVKPYGKIAKGAIAWATAYSVLMVSSLLGSTYSSWASRAQPIGGSPIMPREIRKEWRGNKRMQGAVINLLQELVRVNGGRYDYMAHDSHVPQDIHVQGVGLIFDNNNNDGQSMRPLFSKPINVHGSNGFEPTETNGNDLEERHVPLNSNSQKHVTHDQVDDDDDEEEENVSLLAEVDDQHQGTGKSENNQKTSKKKVTRSPSNKRNSPNGLKQSKTVNTLENKDDQ